MGATKKSTAKKSPASKDKAPPKAKPKRAHAGVAARHLGPRRGA